MPGLIDILDHIDNNFFDLKWKHKFDKLGQFISKIKVDKTKYDIAFFCQLDKRKDVYLKIRKPKNRILSFFCGKNEPVTYYFKQGDILWGLVDRIMAKLLFKHAKELSFFFAEKEERIGLKVLHILDKIENGN